MTSHSKPTRRTAALSLAGLALSPAVLGSAAHGQGAAAAMTAPSEPIDIAARAITSFSRTSSERRFGRLEFRGGLVLTSTHKDFGGLSGLAMESSGKSFVAVTDAGSWLTADLTYGTNDEPTGLANARIGHLATVAGRDLGRKRDADAEAMAWLDGNLMRGTVLISFERNHRVGRFPVVNRAIQPPAGYLKMPADAKRMSGNKGLEGMTVMTGGPHKGSAVAISERYTDPAGHHTGWIWVGGEPKKFHIKDIDGFDITDCVSLADGSLLLLERRFRWLEGVKMHLRLLKPAEVAPGVVAEGTMLLDADMSSDIDNMEGLGVHRGPKGETVLTLVSDDNFNAVLQRTILLQFVLHAAG